MFIWLTLTQSPLARHTFTLICINLHQGVYAYLAIVGVIRSLKNNGIEADEDTLADRVTKSKQVKQLFLHQNKQWNHNQS